LTASLTVEGPVPGRIGLPSVSFPLASVGYRSEEFFLRGTATAYSANGELGGDGQWDVSPARTADFCTRLVVYRPVDGERFNGTVFVEWLNVSAGADGPPDWLFIHRQLIRAGAAWVGVSAQKAGIDGGGLVDSGGHLRKVSPDRYAALVHPGDSFAYDIFGAAGQAVRRPAGTGVLGALEADTVLATGQSQSAAGLVTYINARGLDGGYDGYLVHGRGAYGLGLDGGMTIPGRRPGPAGDGPGHRIRADLRVPVLTVQSETDVTLLGGGRARQEDADLFRLWEMAGAAHFDTYGLNAASQDDGSKSAADLQGMVSAASGYQAAGDAPFNSGWQQHYVMQAAAAALEAWARHGSIPPSVPRLEAVDDEATDLRRDELGIAVGGLRTPWVDAPVACLSGQRQQSDGFPFGFLFGETHPFSADQLARLYPGGRAEYLERFGQATGKAVEGGVLLEADRDEIEAVAERAWPARRS
jgi:Alpha/beta hydrolase domain